MKFVEELFGKGKKLKDLTTEQRREYTKEVGRRFRRSRGSTPQRDENGLNIVEQIFGKGKKMKDLTLEQRREYHKTYNQMAVDKHIKQILEETIDEMLEDGYAIQPDTEAVLDEAIDEVFNVGLNPEAVPYIPYHLQLD